MVVYTVHVTCQDIDGGATEADGGASAPVGPSVATPLTIATNCKCANNSILHSVLHIVLCSNDVKCLLYRG